MHRECESTRCSGAVQEVRQGVHAMNLDDNEGFCELYLFYVSAGAGVLGS